MEFYGQDAQFDGHPLSYRVNGDGTVYDNVTGLTWQRDPNDNKFDWQTAQNYCDVLDFAGRTDWRVPSAKELFSINSFASGWPYLDADVFDLNGDEKDQQYWTSNFYFVGTTHNGQPSAFGVNHVTGHIKAYPAGGGEREGGRPPAPPENPPPGANAGSPPDFGKYVRCLAGEPYGVNAFTDNADGTVSDTATGLMWSQTDAGEMMNWQDALAYAERMNAERFLGYVDWRLPNIRELLSIVDYSGVFPAIDGALFQSTVDDSYYWSSTSAYFSAEAPEHYYAWYVAFGYAPGPDGEDIHGAGAVRFASKDEDAPAAEGDTRYLNAVRLVRRAE